jgi:hypothetical protein
VCVCVACGTVEWARFCVTDAYTVTRGSHDSSPLTRGDPKPDEMSHGVRQRGVGLEEVCRLTHEHGKGNL